MKLSKKRKIQTNGHLKIPCPLFWKMMIGNRDNIKCYENWKELNRIEREIRLGIIPKRLGDLWPHAK